MLHHTEYNDWLVVHPEPCILSHVDYQKCPVLVYADDTLPAALMR